jgi:hypothetical protein
MGVCHVKILFFFNKLKHRPSLLNWTGEDCGQVDMRTLHFEAGETHMMCTRGLASEQ